LELAGWGSGVDLSPPEGFVGVDVAETGDDLLSEEEILDPLVSLEALSKRLEGELRGERLGAGALGAACPMGIEGKTRGALPALAREAATTKGWSIRSATRNAPAGPASLLW